MKIRTATQNDLQTLLEFEQKIITAERPMDPTLKQQGEIHYYPIDEYIDSNDTEVLVAEADDQVIASLYGQIRNRKPFFQTSQLGYIGFMYVKSAYRGQGVSQNLIAAITKWFNQNNVTEIILHVYAKNPRAIRAYQKAGFEKHLIEMRLIQENK